MDESDKEDKKPRNWIAALMISAAIIISIIVLVLIASITGLIKIDGFLGYQTMPDVKDLTQEEAIDTLQAAHFNTSKVKYEYRASDKYDEGRSLSLTIKREKSF